MKDMFSKLWHWLLRLVRIEADKLDDKNNPPNPAPPPPDPTPNPLPTAPKPKARAKKTAPKKD